MKKRLIVCFDGTWKTPDNGPNPTNVVKIMRAIRTADGDVPQIKFYETGVGTGGPLNKFVGGAFGRGLVRNIHDGYRFLANNFVLGDEIYVFGFSRGAYTARSLGGFMGAVGLLKRQEMERLPDAWDLYKTKPHERDEAKTRELRALGHDKVRITCLGVWDTVGALGVPGETLQWVNHGDHEFHDTELGGNVDHAFHAVAIDEKRGPFAPTLWQTPVPETVQTVEQVWFPGVHSNIGGSYEDSGLSDLALEWMIGRVRAKTDLAFDDAYLGDGKTLRPDHRGQIYESRGGLYAISKRLPYLRLIDQCEVPRAWWRRFVSRTNRPRPGQEFANEALHWSAQDRFGQIAKFDGRDEVYRPETLGAALDKGVPVVGRDRGPPLNPGA